MKYYIIIELYCREEITNKIKWVGSFSIKLNQLHILRELKLCSVEVRTELSCTTPEMYDKIFKPERP
jgi:hypothetical protein